MPAEPAGRDWAAYYAKTGARPPRETVRLALARFDDEGLAPADRFAVDLGCGSGRDTVEILRHGWRVLAIDAEPDAIAALTARDDVPADAQLERRVARFEDADWPPARLVNSSFALPMCPPTQFGAVWARIAASLLPGGRFAGQLCGVNDSWAGRPGMTFHRRDEVDALLAGFAVEHVREEEDDSTTPRGEAKHWHIFHIVIRKP